jgi:hypothetical protein
LDLYGHYVTLLVHCLQVTTLRMLRQCSLPWWLVLRPVSRSRAPQQAAREDQQAAWQQVRGLVKFGQSYTVSDQSLTKFVFMHSRS